MGHSFVLANTLSTTLGDALMTLLSFILLFLVVKRAAWKPLMNILEERDKQIQEDLDKAKAAHERAVLQEATVQNEIRENRKKANELLTRAQVEGNEMKRKILEDARFDADRIRQHAHKEVELEKQQALESMRTEVSELSILIAEQIMKKDLSAVDHERYIEEFIDELAK